MKYYLDSATIIYIVEDVHPYITSVNAKLSVSGLTLVSSELAWLECRVKPLRLNDGKLLLEFEDYFVSMLAEVLPLTRAVVDRATDLRARYNFKTPDALHLAAALTGGCDVFLTNDQRLSRCQELRIETV